MELDVKTQCERLAAACDLQRSEDFDAYVEAIAFLRTHPSSEVLDHMLRCLRDVDAGEVQYELIEACEAYDSSVYIAAFIRNAKHIFSQAPKWSELMLCSILNASNDADGLCAALQSADPQAVTLFRAEIERISRRVNSKYKEFLAKLPDD